MRFPNQHSHTSSNGNGSEPPNPGSRRRPTTMDSTSDPWSENPPAASLAEHGQNGCGLVRLSALIQNPELYELPDPVVEKLAWPGRLSVLAAREKTGKSTLITAAAAAATIGSGLLRGRHRDAGLVLYYNLEEHVGDLVRRFLHWEADPDRVIIRDHLPGFPIAQLQEDVAQVRPALVVIDSLTQLAACRNREPSTDVQWGRFMDELLSVPRSSNAAVLTAHHGRRSDGRYRGSSAIGAAADVILEMSCGASETERRIDVNGRFGPDEFTFELVEDGGRPSYRLTEEGLPLDDRILRYLRLQPGASMSEVRGQVRGSADEIRRVLHQLQEQRLVENRRDGQSHAWHVVERG